MTPLVEDGLRHGQIAAEIQALREGRDALRPYFAGLKAALLERRLELLTQDATRWDARIKQLGEQRDNARIEQGKLEGALRENGGDRLQQLAAAIQQHEAEKQQRQEKADAYTTLLTRIGEAAPGDEAAFMTQRSTIGEHAEALRTSIADHDTQINEDGYALRRGQEEHKALSDEIDSLARRKAISMRPRYASATHCAPPCPSPRKTCPLPVN